MNLSKISLYLSYHSQDIHMSLVPIPTLKLKNIMGKVKCLECGKTIESKHRHDYVTCGCPNQTMVDGGNDYCRYGGVDISKVKVIEHEKATKD